MARRIGGDEFVDMAVRETAAMQHDAAGFERDAAGLAGGKHPHRVRIGQIARHHAFGVVIALDDEGRNALAVQPADRADEEQPGGDILPAAVEHIAGDDQEAGLAGDGLGDQRLDRAPPCLGKARRHRRILQPQPGERAVDMQIGGMDETEAHEAK